MPAIDITPPIPASAQTEAGDNTRSVVDAVPEAIAVVDLDGIIAEANRHMVTLSGRSRDELVGTPLRECFAEEGPAESLLRQASATGSVANRELVLRHRGGPRTVVSCVAAIIQDGSPVPDRVLVVTRVGVEQNRALALASLVESADDAIVGKTIDGMITSWNSGAERLYGYAEEQVVGGPFEIVVPETARADEWGMLRRAAAGERVEPYEAERLCKNGTPVTVSVVVSPVLDAGGAVVGVASISRDVSELKRADAKFRWMIEVAPDAILGVDASGSVEVVNAQCERLFGYGRDELMGRPVKVLIPRGLRPVDAGQVGAGTEVAALHKDGTQIPVEVSLSALETPAGRLTMAAVRDITDRKGIERQLREQNVELEQASRAKDNFLASMSHELRTPLNAIIGFTGTMLMKLPGPLNAEQEHQLRLVQTSGKHLLSIINDLLDLAKIESGKVQVTLQPVDCRRVVEEIVQSLQPLAERKGIALRIDGPDAPLMATADQRILGQILINLVNNAIKFTDSGEVRVRVIPKGQDGELRISVCDTGPGIPEADQERIFRAFERSAITAKNSDEGTGLGLHISRKLAGLLNGILTVSSAVGEGSTFTISLAEK
jgi:protein-histidine pros-kinase